LDCDHMRVIHRFAFRLSAERRQELVSLGVHPEAGVAMPGGGDPFVAVLVPEDHENWPRLKAKFDLWQVRGSVATEFSKAEIRAARWVELEPAWHYGYPQPREDEFGYLEATYDLSEYCPECGTGKVQKAPFQMKGEPKWGRRSILQLNWVFDEYFVTPDVWESVFQPHGVRCRPVLNRKHAELKTVVQLVVEEQVGIDVGGLASQTCGRCGRVKYLPHTGGFFPPLVNEPSAAMVKTNKVFGDGASAQHAVIISQDIVRAMTNEKVKGASFKPVDGGDARPAGRPPAGRRMPFTPPTSG